MAAGWGGGRTRTDLPGFSLVIVSAFCYASLSVFGKIAYTEGVGTISLLATRFTLAALFLWAGVLLVPGLRRQAGALPRGRALTLVAWGACGFALQSALFFAALETLSASLTEVLLYTCPAWLAVIVWARSGRPPSGVRLAALAMALLGTWLCAGRTGVDAPAAGVALAMAAGLWYAFFILGLDRLTAGVPGFFGGSLIITGAAISFDIAALFRGGFRLPATPAAWLAVLGMVTFATVAGFWLFVAGLQRVGPQTASILSTFEPVGTLLLAAVVLEERLTPPRWAGVSLVVGAAAVLAATGARVVDRVEGDA
jgi:drug/metabolite transporter (DMT)-like permease